jgi:hypothetical protein
MGDKTKKSNSDPATDDTQTGGTKGQQDDQGQKGGTSSQKDDTGMPQYNDDDPMMDMDSDI